MEPVPTEEDCMQVVHPTKLKLLETNPPTNDAQLELLSDVGPELVNRWSHSKLTYVSMPDKTLKNNHFHPVMYRSLISSILRATTIQEAKDAYQSYKSLVSNSSNKNNNGIAILGFTSDMESMAQTSIWLDIFQTASRNDTLLADSATLKYYNDSGAGCHDNAEYDSNATASSDRRVKGYTHPPNHGLHDIRTLSLSYVIQIYANYIILCHKNQSNIIDEILNRFHSNVFYQPLFEYCQKGSADLSNDVIDALHHFYNMYYQYGTSSETQEVEFKNRIIQALMQMITDNVVIIQRFLYCIQDITLRIHVTKLCLEQRFAIPDIDLNLTKFDNHNNKKNKLRVALDICDNYLCVQAVNGRPNAALPALLYTLLFSWCELCVEKDQDKIKIKKGTKTLLEIDRETERDVSKALERINKAKQRNWAAEFTCPEQDIVALQLSLRTFAHRLLMIIPPPSR